MAHYFYHWDTSALTWYAKTEPILHNTTKNIIQKEVLSPILVLFEF